MRNKQKKEYSAPDFEKMYVTEDAVLESGESGGLVPPTPGENEGEIDVFSLG